MTIELGVSPRALFDFFDSKQVLSGMSREVPGGATIQLGAMMERRDLPSIQADGLRADPGHVWLQSSIRRGDRHDL